MALIVLSKSETYWAVLSKSLNQNTIWNHRKSAATDPISLSVPTSI
jgi:hypothetical protein